MSVAPAQVAPHTPISSTTSQRVAPGAPKKRRIPKTKVVPVRSKKKLKKDFDESSDSEASDADEHGNLAGFIANDTDDDEKSQQEKQEEEKELTAQETAQQLIDELKPEERELMLKSMNDTGGRRRSSRTRKAPTRFFPKEYVAVFMTKGGEINPSDVEEVFGSDSDGAEDKDDDDDVEDDDEGENATETEEDEEPTVLGEDTEGAAATAALGDDDDAAVCGCFGGGGAGTSGVCGFGKGCDEEDVVFVFFG